MGELFVEGPEAGAASPPRSSATRRRSPIGRAHYSMICAPDGGIIDDLIVYRLGRGAVPRRRQRRQRRRSSRDELAARLAGFRAVLDDRSLATALVAIQGPRAVEILAPLTDVDLDALRYYAIAEGTVAGHPGARRADRLHGRGRLRGLRRLTARAAELWDALARRRAGRRACCRSAWARATRSGSRPGMPLYGNELDRDDEPVRGRPRPGRKLDKPGDFVGRAALERVAADGAGEAARRARRCRAAASPATATRSTPATGGPAS